MRCGVPSVPACCQSARRVNALPVGSCSPAARAAELNHGIDETVWAKTTNIHWQLFLTITICQVCNMTSSYCLWVRTSSMPFRFQPHKTSKYFNKYLTSEFLFWWNKCSPSKIREAKTCNYLFLLKLPSCECFIIAWGKWWGAKHSYIFMNIAVNMSFEYQFSVLSWPF